MSTVLLLLAGHATIALETPTMPLVSTIVSCLFYVSALNSTLNSLPYVFIAVFYPYGWLFILPFLTFITGKRFTTGFTKRKDKHDKIGITVFRGRYLLRAVKVIAYYVYVSFWPSRLGLFHEWGYGKEFYTKRAIIYSVILCLAYLTFGLLIDWRMVLAWFLFIALFSQYVNLGQFIAERYTLVANVCFCVIVARFIVNPVIYAVVVCFWFYRSHLYIKTFKNLETLYTNGILSFPQAPENYNNLGSYYVNCQRYAEALRPLFYGLQLSRGNKSNIHIQIARCYQAKRDYKSALEHIDKALIDCPKDKEAEYKGYWHTFRNKAIDQAHNEKMLKKLRPA